MEKNKRKTIIILSTLFALLISVPIAIATSKPGTVILPLEVVTSDRIIFYNVKVINKDDCIQIKGSVKPRKNQSPGMLGHVDVELLDGEGRTLKKDRVGHTPAFLHTKGNKRSYFTYTLGEEAQNCSKVRIGYHYTRNAEKIVCSSNHH